jgi:cell pole-organizing protein PopZ
MSSSTSPQHDRMLAQQRAHEPSMEEILASIRRIIADDSQSPAAPAAPPAVELRPEPAFRPAAVRESAFRDAPRASEPTPLAPNRPANAEPAPSPRAESFEALTARLGGPRAEPPRAPAPAEETFDVGQAIVEAVSEDLAARPLAEPAPMLSRDADAAVAAQFGKLSDALMANNAQRLDEMTRQMLRPLLKSWLDDNLPVLVERLVRAEIERVARGGR